MSVVGVVDGQSTSGLIAPAEKKKKADIKKSSKSVKSDKTVKSSSSRPPATSSTDQGKSTTSSTDSRISDLDKKWSDRFNRLEALLMAKTLDRPQDPTFSTVKVAPTHTPPANVVRTDPFLKPVTQSSQLTDRPAVDSPTTDLSQHRSTTKASSSTQPEPTTAQTSQRQLSSAFDTSRKECSTPVILIWTVCHRTDHPWISSRKRVNFLKIKRPTCLIMTNPSRRNNPTGKL